MLDEIFEFLRKYGYLDQMYESLQQDDYSEVVITALNALPKGELLLHCGKETKCDSTSTTFRKIGNNQYQRHKYYVALKFYNKAILSATENSTAYKLGFSNRSALLYTIKAYRACLNDIDSCLNIGRTDEALADRLTQRKRECQRWVHIDDFQIMVEQATLGGTFFHFNVERNPQIPSASLDVGVVKETDTLKTVAVRNIEVGTLVSVETAYACSLATGDQYLACYYCHKFDLNLIPCNNCCEVMFCSEICKARCNKEFHKIECSCKYLTTVESSFSVASQAAIKMRQMSSSWAEFIEASKNIGAKRMKESSINEIYDVNNKFSILSFDRDLHFLYGELCNVSLRTAMLIYILLEASSFFPERPAERDEAIRAFARVIVNTSLFYKKLPIVSYKKKFKTGRIINTMPTDGLFSFTGKLKHDCDANLLLLGLNNKVALIAIKPINKGDELTISYVGHYFDYVFSRPLKLLCHSILCNCCVCTEKWSRSQYRNKTLTIEEQRAVTSALASDVLPLDPTVFKDVCDCLTTLQDSSGTKEYHQVYERFEMIIGLFQCLYTNNVTIT